VITRFGRLGPLGATDLMGLGVFGACEGGSGDGAVLGGRADALGTELASRVVAATLGTGDATSGVGVSDAGEIVVQPIARTTAQAARAAVRLHVGIAAGSFI